MKNLLLLILPALLLTSCVSKRKYLDMLGDRDEYKIAMENLRVQLDNCRREKDELRAQIREKEGQLGASQSEINALKQQLEYVKSTNTNLLERLSDLSVSAKPGRRASPNRWKPSTSKINTSKTSPPPYSARTPSTCRWS